MLNIWTLLVEYVRVGLNQEYWDENQLYTI